jgi:hypothetical protein
LGIGAAAGTSGLSPHQRTQIQSLFEKRRLQPDQVDELVAAAAVQALGRGRERSAVSLLCELLREGNDEVQRQAAWALGAIGDGRAVAPLLRAVFVKSQPVRQAAVLALGQLRAAGGSAPLPRLPTEQRGQDGLDVARLLGDALRYGPPPAGRPAWLAAAEPASLIAAVDEALLLHRDVALRTLADLTGDGAAAELRLGPLSDQLATAGSDIPQLLTALGLGLLPTLGRLVSGLVGVGSAADPAVRDGALLVIGRLAAAGDGKLKQQALALLCEVALSSAPQAVVLRAAELLAGHVGELAEAEQARLSARPLDRLLSSGPRAARLAALAVASRPGGGVLVSERALKQAAADGDGYVREAAQQALSEQRRAFH